MDPITLLSGEENAIFIYITFIVIVVIFLYVRSKKQKEKFKQSLLERGYVDGIHSANPEDLAYKDENGVKYNIYTNRSIRIGKTLQQTLVFEVDTPLHCEPFGFIKKQTFTFNPLISGNYYFNQLFDIKFPERKRVNGIDMYYTTTENNASQILPFTTINRREIVAITPQKYSKGVVMLQWSYPSIEWIQQAENEFKQIYSQLKPRKEEDSFEEENE